MQSALSEKQLPEDSCTMSTEQEKSHRYAIVTEEAYQTFKAIQKIRDVAAQTVNELMASDEQLYVRDGRRGWPEPNPYGGETDQGILVKTDALFTPWGWVQLFGKGSNDSVQKAFEEKLTVSFNTIKSNQDKEDHVYKVQKVDTIELPDPSEKTSPTSYMPPEIALQVWLELDKRYKKEFEGISPIYIKGQEPKLKENAIIKVLYLGGFTIVTGAVIAAMAWLWQRKMAQHGLQPAIPIPAAPIPQAFRPHKRKKD
jgi:hypothetical protein